MKDFALYTESEDIEVRLDDCFTILRIEDH